MKVRGWRAARSPPSRPGHGGSDRPRWPAARRTALSRAWLRYRRPGVHGRLERIISYREGMRTTRQPRPRRRHAAHRAPVALVGRTGAGSPGGGAPAPRPGASVSRPGRPVNVPDAHARRAGPPGGGRTGRVPSTHPGGGRPRPALVGVRRAPGRGRGLPPPHAQRPPDDRRGGGPPHRGRDQEPVFEADTQRPRLPRRRTGRAPSGQPARCRPRRPRLHQPRGGPLRR